jgi:hypothetical protein
MHNTSYLSKTMTGGRTRDLFGEMTFLGRSKVDDERVFTGVLSLRCKRRILTHEAHLKVETPAFVVLILSVAA